MATPASHAQRDLESAAPEQTRTLARPWPLAWTALGLLAVSAAFALGFGAGKAATPASPASHSEAPDAAPPLGPAVAQRKLASSGLCCDRCAREKRVWALQGGGFLAFTDFSAVVSGLLAAQQRGGHYDSGLDGLLSNFEAVSSISAGTWFASQLAYSSQFQSLVEDMAAQPSQAEQLFSSRYLAKLFDPSGLNLSDIPAEDVACLSRTLPLLLNPRGAPPGGPPPALELQLQLLEQIGFGQWALEILAFLLPTFRANGTLTWEGLVETMNVEAAGLPASVRLGAGVNSWAHGKLLLLGTTVPAPNGTATGDQGLQGQVLVFAPQGPEESVTYTVQSAPGDLLPAKFSIVAGKQGSRRSPAAFCDACRPAELDYSLASQSTSGNFSPQTLGGILDSAFGDSASLPLSAVSAASSPFLWALGVNGVDASDSCPDLAVWASRTPGGQSFGDAADLRASLFRQGASAGSAAELASEAGLFALVDAGASDDAGVGHAVAAGADSVVVFLDLDVTEFQDNLGGVLGSEAAAGRLLQYWAGDGPTFRSVFDSPSPSEVASSYAGFKRIAPAVSSEFLSAIAYGSIECVTRDNPVVGVSGGRTVTVHILSVETVQIGVGLIQLGRSFDSFFDYATLAGHIVQTLAAEGNDAEVSAILSEFFG